MSSKGEFATATDVGHLADAVTALLDSSFMNLTDDEVTDALRTVEECSRQLVVVSRRLTIEATERSLPEHSGADTMKRFLIETLRLSAPDAGARVKAARRLGTWHDLNGDPMPVTLPLVAQAQAAGELSVDHVRGIEAVMQRIPADCTSVQREAAEQHLVTYARTGWPEDLGKIGERILAHLDPDGTLTTDTDRQRQRGIVIGRPRADGMRTIKGEITPEFSAILDPKLAKYARPGMCMPEDAQSPTVAGDADLEVLRAAADRDNRSAAQRTHDALQALLEAGIDTKDLGSHRGLPVTTILTMSIDQVEAAAGVATTATNGTVPISTALKLAERSLPYLAIFDHAGMPLHLGRTNRLASPAQRLALIASVRGCSRPGCDAPASLSAVHHVTEWSKDGPTDLNNLTLACDHCHALIHDGPGGWKTIVVGKGSRYAGRTAWIAPRHIDPTQTPRINHRHHAGELLAHTVESLNTRNERQAQERRERVRRATAVASKLPAAG